MPSDCTGTGTSQPVVHCTIGNGTWSLRMGGGTASVLWNDSCALLAMLVEMVHKIFLKTFMYLRISGTCDQRALMKGLLRRNCSNQALQLLAHTLLLQHYLLNKGLLQDIVQGIVIFLHCVRKRVLSLN